MVMYNGTYCVYMHTNIQNQKKYIGQTVFGNDIGKRWRNGEGYKGCTAFYRAIQKYGWNGFEHEIIASNLTQDEANHFEELLIQLLDTTNPKFGYNLKTGGENHGWSEISKVKMAQSRRAAYREKHKVQSEKVLKERFEQKDPCVKKCIKCGVLFEVVRKGGGKFGRKSMKEPHKNSSPRMCPDCRNDYYNKPKNIIKICVDCGNEFVCASLATKTIRCKECTLIHEKQRQLEYMKSRREKEKT